MLRIRALTAPACTSHCAEASEHRSRATRRALAANSRGGMTTQEARVWTRGTPADTAIHFWSSPLPR